MMPVRVRVPEFPVDMGMKLPRLAPSQAMDLSVTWEFSDTQPWNSRFVLGGRPLKVMVTVPPVPCPMGLGDMETDTLWARAKPPAVSRQAANRTERNVFQSTVFPLNTTVFPLNTNAAKLSDLTVLGQYTHLSKTLQALADDKAYAS